MMWLPLLTGGTQMTGLIYNKGFYTTKVLYNSGYTYTTKVILYNKGFIQQRLYNTGFTTKEVNALSVVIL